MKRKNEVPALIELYHAMLLNQTGYYMLTLRTDNGRAEYDNHEADEFLSEVGIRHETSAPYTPAQNGTAERVNRTLLNSVRAMLISSGLPPSLWGEAVSYSVYIRNRVLSRTNNTTPYEIWNNKQPDVSNIRIFGSRAFIRNPTPSSKLEARSLEGIFVGRCISQNAFRIYIPSTRKVLISKDVRVDETILYRDMTKDLSTLTNELDVVNKEKNPTSPLMTSVSPQDTPVPPSVNDYQVAGEMAPHQDTMEDPPIPAKEPNILDDKSNAGSSLVTHPATTVHLDPATGGTIQNDAIILNDETEQVTDTTPISTRRSRRKPKYSDKYQLYMKSLAKQAIFYGMAAEHSESKPTEPRSYREAITCADAKFWIAAIAEEYDSLIRNGTWTICPLPVDRKAIQGKWIMKFKPGFKTTPPRYKARFVIKGYSQVYGLDYKETYAPVVKNFSIRSIMAIAAARDLEIIQLEVKTAFLYGNLDEEIYIEQPERFVTQGREQEVCRLIKSIYGFQQASRVWNIKFNEFIILFGLTRSTADPCVYYRHLRRGEADEELTIFILYVDDGLIISNLKAVLTEMMVFLSKEFEFRSLPADRFIGVDINRNRIQHTIHLSQPEYTKAVLERYGMSNCAPHLVPADPSVKLTPQMCPQKEEEKESMKAVPFRECIGSVMHLTHLTRPDIAYAVGQVSRYSQNPGQEHWKALKRIMAYLRKTMNFGLLFGGTSGDLIGYCDADYAGDLGNIRSTSGVVFTLHNGPISWFSRRQSCVALSTTESEFISAAEATKEAIWLNRILTELGVGELPVTLKCDNQGAIALIHDPVFHQRTKHIDVRFFFVRDAQAESKVNISYIETENQLADIFTKALAAPRFEKLRSSLNICEL